MPVFSYVHHLFNVDQCQAYIHTLRWKDRPLQCPRCQSQDIAPWGRTTTDPGANAPGVAQCIGVCRWLQLAYMCTSGP